MRCAIIAVMLLGSIAFAKPKSVIGPKYDRRCDVRSSTRLHLCSASEAVAFSFVSAPPSVPQCTAAVDGSLGGSCAFLCTPNAGGTAWQCVDGNGAALGTITQGTGSTYVNTFASGVKALNDVTDATAPTAVTPTLDSIWAGDLTLVMGGYGTLQTGAFPTYFVYAGTGGGIVIRANGGNMEATWLENGSFPISNVSQLGLDGWSVVSARRSGNSRVMRVNGADGAADNTVTTKVAATAGAISYFGRSNSAGQPLRGPLAFIAGYTVSKTAAQMEQIEAGFWGMNPVGLGVVDGIPQLGGLDNTAISGQVDMYQSGAWPVSATYGIHTQKGFVNAWAADPLDATTWTAVGGGTSVANVASGPFSRWKNKAEVDRVVDASAAAFSGYQSNGSAGTAVGAYTTSCFVAAGDVGVTLDKVRLVVTTDGTGSTNCDFSGLTSTYTRKICKAVIGGVPTFVKGQVLVGNAITDVGSVLVSQCEVNAGAYAETPTVNNTNMGNGAGTLPVSSFQNPFGAGGKVELVFTSHYNVNTDWATVAENLYLYDFYSTPQSDHSVVGVFGYTSPGVLLSSWRNTSINFTDIQTVGIGTIPFQTYAYSMEWRPNGGTNHCNVYTRLNTCSNPATCRATTIVASDTTGTAWCPSQPTSAYFGNRYDASVPTSEYVYSIKVYR